MDCRRCRYETRASTPTQPPQDCFTTERLTSDQSTTPLRVKQKYFRSRPDSVTYPTGYTSEWVGTAPQWFRGTYFNASVLTPRCPMGRRRCAVNKWVSKFILRVWEQNVTTCPNLNGLLKQLSIQHNDGGNMFFTHVPTTLVLDNYGIIFF